MDRLTQKFNQFINWLKKHKEVKTYKIKFKKVKRNISDCILYTSWTESSNAIVHQGLIDLCNRRDDISVKKIVVNSAAHSSYIKFKSTIEGYNYIFSFFTHSGISQSLNLISSYNP